MDQTKQSTFCQLHQQQYIITNCEPENQTSTKLQCPKCLIQNNDSYVIDEMSEHLNQLKTDYKIKKITQNKQNLEILKEVEAIVIMLKASFSQKLNQIHQTVTQQIKIIEDFNIDERLQQVSIDNPQLRVEQNNEILNIQTELESFKVKDIDRCLNLLKSVDNRNISFISQANYSKQKKLKQTRTPYLPLACKKHEKEIILFDLNEGKPKEDRLACILCISDKPSVGPLTDIVVVKKLYNDYEDKKKELMLNNLNKISTKVKSIQEQINQLLMDFTKNINETSNKLQQQYKLFEQENDQEIDRMYQNLSSLSIEQVSDIAEALSKPYLLIQQCEINFLKQNDQINQVTQESLKFLQEIYNSFLSTFPQMNEETIQEGDQSNQETNAQNLDRQIETLNERPYEIITECSKKQSDYCYSLAFNKEQTIMVAGCGVNKIAVYEFNNGQLTQKQILNEHTTGGNYIFTLNFMQKSNKFISGTYKEIGIWSFNNQQWYCQQLLKQAHSNVVNRVILNKNEDQIISCSNDKTIKFWRFKNDWECSQILNDHTDCVCSISLNDSCNQLVSCGEDNKILIISQDGDLKWNVIQIIQVNAWGYRICFIDDDLITFQPKNEVKMEIYQYDQENQKYIKCKEVLDLKNGCCNCWFPQIFNVNKQLLLNKNGYTINMMRRKNKTEFVVEQTIQFGGQHVYGSMTDDGEFLVTWDSYSREFQIRKQK